MNDDETAAHRSAALAAQEELMNLVMGMIQSGKGAHDLGTPALLDKMEEIVGRFGLNVPGLADQIPKLRTATTSHDRRFRLSMAAEWAGDLDRMRFLQQVPWPDTSQLLPDDLFDDEADVSDDDEWDQTEDEAPLPDPFEELANGKPGALDALIASGMDLNLRAGKEGRTALQAALEAPGRRAQHLLRLMAAGAQLFPAGPTGEDPIFSAIGYPHHATVTPDSEQALFDLLFDKGCDPNAASPLFGTATLAAILLGRPAEVRVMLDAGGRIDVPFPGRYPGDGMTGYSCLMLAAPKPETFRLLLSRGADPDAPCPGGESLQDFLEREVGQAQDLADHDDWCHAHAASLAASLALLRGP